VAIQSNILKTFVRANLWLILMVLGAAGFLTVYLLPHQSEIDSPLQVIYKIVVFLVISAGIALFPNRSRCGYLLLLVPLLGFLGYIIPRISYLGFVAVPQGLPNAEGEFYTYLYLMLFPATLLSITLAYRLGGGTAGNCLKIASSGTILIFSGFLDLLWFVVNPIGIPSTLQYAHHIEMIIGHYPSYSEGIAFAVLHLPILGLVLLLPLDRWLHRLLEGPAAPAPSRGPERTNSAAQR